MIVPGKVLCCLAKIVTKTPMIQPIIVKEQFTDFSFLTLTKKRSKKNHFILEAAMTHTRLQNIKWENDNLISYEILKLHGNPNTGEGNSIEKWQMNTE